MPNPNPKDINKNIFYSLSLLACLTIILILFVPTLYRPWLIYDEKIIFDNSFFPSPINFSEIVETFKQFSLIFNFNSSNAIYSSNSIIRSSPISLILNTLINFFLKKNPFSYHLLILILHIVNTVLVYLIIKTISNFQQNGYLNNIFLFLLTTIWAIHPVILESVLLSTNFPRLFTYIFFFSFFLDFLKNSEKNASLKRRILIPLLFLIPMFSTECMIVLPFVLFVTSFQQTFPANTLKASIKKSFNYTLPYFTGAIIYLFYFLFLSHTGTNHPLQGKAFIVLLERIFWLSPQIFFHDLMLILYPKTLSIDQTLFVHLGKTLFSPYSIFCLIFLMLWLFIPVYYFVIKKKYPDLFFLTWTFFFALLPFLHILMPSYALSAERYLYCPLAFIVFSLVKVISNNKRFTTWINLFLSLILILCFIRSYYRTADWKDNYSFINATYKSTKNPLFKGIGSGMLAKAITILEPQKTDIAKNYFIESLNSLEIAKSRNEELKLKFQKSLPEIVKSYGLDYESILSKIAYLKVASKCIEFNEAPEVGLEILTPVIQNIDRLDSNIFELYAHLLILKNRVAEAKTILLKANSFYPHSRSILVRLFDLTMQYENNKEEAEAYISDLLKYYLYDISILSKAHDFYQSKGNIAKTAQYAYLYGIRTHTIPAYNQALYLYLQMNDLRKAKEIVSKLSAISGNDPQSIYLINLYLSKTKGQKS